MRRSVLPALLLTVALSACGFSDEDGAAEGSAPTASSSTPADESAGATEAARNERGNIPVQVGEEIALRPSADPDEPPAVTLSVEEIVVDVVCDDDNEEPPENGHYLAVRLIATATDRYDPRLVTPISDYDFAVIGEDGETYNPVSEAAQVCLEQERLIQNMRIAPGVDYDGWLVFDVPVTTGALVYAPEGPTGWEWAF
ncbi:DUF4352 domain-containing protein [Blastococcus sp. TF02-09]|uniref:DUF4352 domain-containing protein n=1 Tax=Blastococcus sp. TF02-09 TaxID=2250576 RepID=UPI0011BF2CFB|nr:DUF4352 domain-containing protein [Blastococcus sp. TF02-9]